MFKKIVSTTIIFFLIISLNAEILKAAEPPIKAIMVDATYGKPGFGFGAGFRWWLFSANLGLAGFANKIPAYSRQRPTDVNINPGQALPEGYTSDSYNSIQVTIDLGVHIDYYDPISIFIHGGFFNASDTVLAVNHDGGFTNRYFWRVETISGFAWGAGLEYIYSNSVSFALGYHTRKGLIGRVVFTWW